MSTFMARKQGDGKLIGPKGEMAPRWFVIDATDQVVGRLAVQIANILRGKHRPEYTPHQDTGEFVIVVNASKIKFTGKKMDT
jgi:large subunit ribosomal protein L13